MSSEAAISVIRRNTEEVQSGGNFEVFEEIFASDFVDHTPQPGGFTPDRDGARNLYRTLRVAFPDFNAEIHWQISDGDRVTTYKTYHGTHEGIFWGLTPTTTSAPVARSVSARSSSRWTNARTGKPLRRSISTIVPPTPPRRPAAPVTRIGTSIDMIAPPTLPEVVFPRFKFERECNEDGDFI